MLPASPAAADPGPSIAPVVPSRGCSGKPGKRFPLPLVSALVALPSRLLLAAIWVYQRTLSPVLPVVTGGACGCRFAPTCSHYAAEAIRVHGALAGTWLALHRIVRCTPLHPGGLDPVPPPSAPRCVRLNTARPLPSRS